MKGEKDKSIIIVRGFNIQLSVMDKRTVQKIKQIEDLNNTTNLDLLDIYRTYHQTIEYTFFSSAHGIFYRIDPMLVHKTNFSKFKRR